MEGDMCWLVGREMNGEIEKMSFKKRMKKRIGGKSKLVVLK